MPAPVSGSIRAVRSSSLWTRSSSRWSAFGAPPKRMDPFQLGEIPDLAPLQQHVPDEARTDRDAQDDHQVAALARPEALAQTRQEVGARDGRERQEPAEVDRRPPWQHQGHETWQQQQVPDALGRQRRGERAADHRRDDDPEHDDEGRSLGSVNELPREQPPAAERGDHDQHVQRDGRQHAFAALTQQDDRVEEDRRSHDQEADAACGSRAAALDRAEAAAAADRQVFARADAGDRLPDPVASSADGARRRRDPWPQRGARKRSSPKVGPTTANRPCPGGHARLGEQRCRGERAVSPPGWRPRSTRHCP